MSPNPAPNPAPSPAPNPAPLPTQRRTRLSLAQKEEILRRVTCGATTSELKKDFNCSVRTIANIKAKKESIQAAIQSQGSSQRKAVHNIRFPVIEEKLLEFVHIARAAKLPVSLETLQLQALHIRDRLLERTSDEADIARLNSFSASSTWVLRFSKRSTLHCVKLHGSIGSVFVTNATSDISSLREMLQAFDPGLVFNMGETGLFFKLFPKRTYVLGSEDKNLLRGTNDMKAKARVSVFVCANATGTQKVPLAVMGLANNPPCFRKGTPPVAYFSQKFAWSDSVTYRRWFMEVFLPFVRKKTSKPVALVMDSCGPHASDVSDVNGQVKVFTLASNSTSVVQPMDMGVIAILKAKYKTGLLHKVSQSIVEREAIREAAKALIAELKGLDEGHDPHLLDVTELLKSAWEDISVSSVAQCWIKADILPRPAHANLVAQYGEVEGHSRRAASEEIEKISMLLSSIKMNTKESSDLFTELQDIEGGDTQAIEKWVHIEDDEDVRQAMVNDCLDELHGGDIENSQIDIKDEAGVVVRDAEKDVPQPVSSMAEVARAFERVEKFCQGTGVDDALYHLRLAKRSLHHAYVEQAKKRRRQVLMAEQLDLQ